MKNTAVILLCLFSLGATAQMQINKSIQLTGSGTNAKIEGIDEIINNNDAANKIYVDTAIANRTSTGGSAPGTLILIEADESSNNIYFNCGSGTSNGNIKTYALPANTYSKIIVEVEGKFEIGANGGSTNSASATVTLPSGPAKTINASRPVSSGGSYVFPYNVSISGASTAGGNITVDGSLSIGGCASGRVYVNTLKVYGVQ